MYRNEAGQKLTVMAVDATTGKRKTGDQANITCYVAKDDASCTALIDTGALEKDPVKAPGLYVLDLTQAEVNAAKLEFSGISTTANIEIMPLPSSVIYTRDRRAGGLLFDGTAVSQTVTGIVLAAGPTYPNLQGCFALWIDSTGQMGCKFILSNTGAAVTIDGEDWLLASGTISYWIYASPTNPTTNKPIVDANILQVDDEEIQGSGTVADPWRPL